MKTLSVSQIQRELHHLQNFNIIEVIDKKRDAIKGYFLDIRHKDIVDKLVAEERKKELSSFVGMWEDREDITLKNLRENAWKK